MQFAIRPDRHWAIQLLLLVWRWRTELTLITAALLTWVKLGDYLPGWPALAVLTAVVAVLFTIPVTRRLLTARLWCLISRHRLRVCLVALRESNYLGRLPWILSARPTPVGERLLIWLRPGFAPADITAKADAIAVACWAREARIEPARRFKAAITVHIIRRDPLTARTRSGDPVVIPNPLTRLAEAARTTGQLLTRTGRRPRLIEPATTALAASDPPAESTVTALRDRKPSTAVDKPTRTTTVPASVAVLRTGEDVSDYV